MSTLWLPSGSSRARLPCPLALFWLPASCPQAHLGREAPLQCRLDISWRQRECSRSQNRWQGSRHEVCPGERLPLLLGARRWRRSQRWRRRRGTCVGWHTHSAVSGERCMHCTIRWERSPASRITECEGCGVVVHLGVLEIFARLVLAIAVIRIHCRAGRESVGRWAKRRMSKTWIWCEASVGWGSYRSTKRRSTSWACYPLRDSHTQASYPNPIWRSLTRRRWQRSRRHRLGSCHSQWQRRPKARCRP